MFGAGEGCSILALKLLPSPGAGQSVLIGVSSLGCLLSWQLSDVFCGSSASTPDSPTRSPSPSPRKTAEETAALSGTLVSASWSEDGCQLLLVTDATWALLTAESWTRLGTPHYASVAAAGAAGNLFPAVTEGKSHPSGSAAGAAAGGDAVASVWSYFFGESPAAAGDGGGNVAEAGAVEAPAPPRRLAGGIVLGEAAGAVRLLLWSEDGAAVLCSAGLETGAFETLARFPRSGPAPGYLQWHLCSSGGALVAVQSSVPGDTGVAVTQKGAAGGVQPGGGVQLGPVSWLSATWGSDGSEDSPAPAVVAPAEWRVGELAGVGGAGSASDSVTVSLLVGGDALSPTLLVQVRILSAKIPSLLSPAKVHLCLPLHPKLSCIYAVR